MIFLAQKLTVVLNLTTQALQIPMDLCNIDKKKKKF